MERQVRYLVEAAPRSAVIAELEKAAVSTCMDGFVLPCTNAGIIGGAAALFYHLTRTRPLTRRSVTDPLS